MSSSDFFVDVRTDNSDGLLGCYIEVIAGCRRGYNIDYIVLIVSRAMKRAQP